MSKDKKHIEALLAKYNQGIKLDIACGGHKQGPDWVGIDIQQFPGVDIVHDIETYPWPLPDNCVSLTMASHIVEHINPAKFGFVNWMNELWRITRVGGQLMIAAPYGVSSGFVQDPTHVNPVNENTWRYFDPLDSSTFYQFYEPGPWRIVQNAWNSDGMIEVLLEKRRDDKSYHRDRKLKYK